MRNRRCYCGVLALILALLSLPLGAESIHSGGGGKDVPSRQRADGMDSPKLPGMIAFLSTLGHVPPVKIDHITPLSEDSPEEVRQWTRRMRLWKINTERLAFLAGTLSRSAKGTTQSSDFLKGLAEIQKRLSEAVAQVNREERKAGGLEKLPVNSLGGVIVSDPARKLQEEVLLLLMGFTESLVEVSKEQPDLSETERRRLALRRLKTRIPKQQLLRVAASEVQGLSRIHQEQVNGLIELRDTLYAKGNFFPFVEQYYQATQSRELLPEQAK